MKFYKFYDSETKILIGYHKHSLFSEQKFLIGPFKRSLRDTE